MIRPITREEHFLSRLLMACEGYVYKSDQMIQAYYPKWQAFYPTLSWEPTQEGSGDPSPDNVRTIAGRNTVSVTRCGKHLFDAGLVQDQADYNKRKIVNNGDGSFTIIVSEGASAATNATSSTSILYPLLPNTTYTVSGVSDNAGLIIGAFDKNGVRTNYYGVTTRNTTFTTKQNEVGMRFYVQSMNTTPGTYTCRPMLEFGSAASEWEPYDGDTIDIDLPETVYGGTLDAGKGVLTVLHGIKSLDYSSNIRNLIEYDNSIRVEVVFDVKLEKENSEAICSHLIRKYHTNDVPHFYITENGANIFLPKTVLTSYDADGVRAYFANQSESGTPVQVCYALQTPYTIQLTPQEITALPGLNTLYTDADKMDMSYQRPALFRMARSAVVIPETEIDVSGVCVLEPVCRKDQFLLDLIYYKLGEEITKTTFEPVTRIEQFMAGLITGECSFEPVKREECAISCCLNHEYMREPVTRIEHFWRAIAQKW
jgi:hypothetical protein